MLRIDRNHLLVAMRSGRHFNATEYAKANPLVRIAGSSNNWLKPFLPPFQRSSIEYPADTSKDLEKAFEEPAGEARIRLSASRLGRKQVVIKRSELEGAIAEGLAELASLPDSGVSPRQRSSLRHGLQMFGVHIEPDDKDDNTPFRLANADLPFSLRFICCSFAMPLSLSSASMVTLDLSGCAVPGIDATFLKLSGSLRLRRLYSSAPLDFTGARIHGFLDGADMVLQPFGDHPPTQAVSPERAMLGLNQAQIDNEIRFQRAQIWGGLTMRGLEAKRSIYMSDAVVLAPLAVLEAMAKAAQKIPRAKAAMELIYRLPGEGSSGRPEHEQARWRVATWQRGWSKELIKGLEAFYAHSKHSPCSTAQSTWESMTLPALLTSNLRARTSAIRADGIKVAGSLFFERLVSHGRVRAKYAQIEGGMTLAGALLRSTEALMPTFDRLSYAASPAAKAIGRYREQTYGPLVDPEDAADTGKVGRGADIFALDLREARIAGDVRIGVADDKVPKGPAWKTRIDGKIAFDQAKLDGKLRMEGVNFGWSQRLSEPTTSAAKYTKQIGKEVDVRKERLARGNEHQISARGLTTSDTVDLCGCRNLKGADFSNAAIGGDLLFFRDSAHPALPNPSNAAPENDMKDRSMLVLEDPALGLSGASIHLDGATIGGDLRLLFDPAPAQGPRIRAQRVTVSGLLSIMPSSEGRPVLLDAENHREVLEKIRTDRQAHREWAAERHGPNKMKVWDERMSVWKRDMPGVDLANANATLLDFPSAAWPRAGRLVISGFNYQRALPHGPLAPHRFEDDRSTYSKVKRRERFWISWAITFAVLAGAVLLAWLFLDPKASIFFGSYPMLALLFAAACAYIAVPRLTSPRSLNIVPMAIEWLELQPPEVNAYRTRLSLEYWPREFWQGLFRLLRIERLLLWFERLVPNKRPDLGNLFRSLEAYTIAADALRREGRWISANLVEQERFRVRNWQLLWRTHFLQKSSFKVADWLTEYGYNYARVAFLSALAIVLATMTTEKAYKCGAITPKDYTVIGVVAPAAQVEPPPKLECPGSPPKGQEDVDEVMFAIDTVLPVTGVAESADWEVNKDTSALGGWACEWARSIVSYNRLLAIFHVSGILLAGILLLGLSTRFGQWLSHYGD